MSAELPFVSSDYVGDRLEQLERRLEQAKQARDNYVQFLKQNQPFLTEEKNQTSQNERLAQRPTLMRRLETSQYFWNFQNQPESYSLTPLPTVDPIPRGMVLNSDFASMTKRLHEIGASIRNMRDYRLNMPSDEYLRSVRPRLQSSPGFSAYYGDPTKADLPSLAEIRSRILNLQFSVERRAREIIDQRNIQATRVNSRLNLADSASGVCQPPEWLQQKEAEDDLKRLSALHLMSQQLLNPSNVEPTKANVEPQLVPRATLAPEDESKTGDDKKSVAISSSRQILFESTDTTTKQQPVSEKLPDNQNLKSQYNRMLDILRPKQIEMSSSDESDTALPMSRQTSSGQQAQTNTKPEVPQSAKPLPSFLQTSSSFPAASVSKPTIAQTLVKATKLSDSDSDFFN